MSLTLDLQQRAWPLREPFAISRSIAIETPTVVVTLTDTDGRRGRGEGVGVAYAGETVATMIDQLEAARRDLEAGMSRAELQALLPPGGARCAVDCALWDLEAKQSGRTAYALAGVAVPQTVHTAFTIGIRSAEAVEATARRYSPHVFLKLKVGRDDPLSLVQAARRGAPNSALIVDPNQAWSVEMVTALAPNLAALGVVLLEQPIPVGAEGGLDGYCGPVPVCADELIDEIADLDKAVGRFEVINIKLDKTGGLTAGLELARAARARGFRLMVGCMAGSSLGMAPAMVLAQECHFVDLDGPLLAAEDWPDGLDYRDGVVAPADPNFWG